MSAAGLARRTEVRLTLDGVDITQDVNKYLISLAYSDNEDGKADDLQVVLDDREGVWMGGWLDRDAAGPAGGQAGALSVGDDVVVTGRAQYTSYGTGTPGRTVQGHRGKITHLNLKPGVPYPVHVDSLGWFAESDLSGAAAGSGTGRAGTGKGAELTAVIVQRNWAGDGKDAALDCGIFQVDTAAAAGPPAQVTLKASSVPAAAAIRTEKKTRAWENYTLSGVAAEVAKAGGLECMYLSKTDPAYERREQSDLSDLVFLQGLCRGAGVALKVTARTIVLFDEAAFEREEAALTIEKGVSDYGKYSFSTAINDKEYKKCTVTYTDPKSGKTYKGTYTAPGVAKGESVQSLSIKDEAVYSNAEAKAVAEKRLREKNKQSFKASFTGLAGDVRLAAGVVVEVKGWGAFDGKYLVETGKHAVSKSGYKTDITCHRVLEGY